MNTTVRWHHVAIRIIQSAVENISLCRWLNVPTEHGNWDTDTLISVFVQFMVAPLKAWQFCSWWFLLSCALCYIVCIYPNFSAKQAFLSKHHRQEAGMSGFLIDSENQLDGVQACLKMSNYKVLLFSTGLCCLLFINVTIAVLGMILITLVSLSIVPQLISKPLWNASRRKVVDDMGDGPQCSVPFCSSVCIDDLWNLKIPMHSKPPIFFHRQPESLWSV